MLIGNIENMWVKPRVQTQITLTDWRTTHEVQGCSKTKMVFFLLLYWCHMINSSWPVAESYAHTTQIMSITLQNEHKVITITSLVFISLEQQRPRLQNCPDYIFISPLNLPLSYSVLSFPCQSVSLFFWYSLQKPAKLHCHVTLTSQLKWHTGYNLTTL